MTTMFERLTSEMVLRRVDEANELARHALDTGQREVAAEALGLAAQYVQLAQNLKRIEEAGLGMSACANSRPAHPWIRSESKWPT